MLAAGANPVTQPGAFLGPKLVFGSGNWLVSPPEDYKINCRAAVTCVISFKNAVWAGTQAGSIYEFPSGKLIAELKSAITALCVASDDVIAGTSEGSLVWVLSGQRKELTPGFYPLTLAFSENLVAIGGTSGSLILMAGDETVHVPGHDSWIKSVDFKRVEGGDLLLASASEDRYIRIWRATRNPPPRESALNTKKFDISGWTVEFEALLIGHDDWVMSARWHPTEPLLLSASADSSLIVWSQDESSSEWTPDVRLGDVSISGATTATGATGVFWSSLWSQDGGVMTTSRTGSWRPWSSSWEALPGTSGHTKSVTDVEWLPSGILLSTSLDQTTRLWSKDLVEVSRPQIHGYDMIAAAALSDWMFASAGDEKTVRIFEMPQPVARLLTSLSLLEGTAKATKELPESAGVPALGLSNKQSHFEEEEAEQELPLTQNPREDHLQRLTLWPEVEKLYGHGYEITTIAASSSLLVSCCKALNEKHAVVRVYDRENWRQVAVLSGNHSSTVTRLRFSPNGRWLVSVSRDRTWALYDMTTLKLHKHMPRAHSRIIWDAAFLDDATFVTASRDKSLRKWTIEGELLSSIKLDAPVTACDATADTVLAGLEDGSVLRVSRDLADAKQVYEATGRINRVSVNSKDSLVAIASETIAVIRL